MAPLLSPTIAADLVLVCGDDEDGDGTQESLQAARGESQLECLGGQKDDVSRLKDGIWIEAVHDSLDVDLDLLPLCADGTDDAHVGVFSCVERTSRKRGCLHERHGGSLERESTLLLEGAEDIDRARPLDEDGVVREDRDVGFDEILRGGAKVDEDGGFDAGADDGDGATGPRGQATCSRQDIKKGALALHEVDAALLADEGDRLGRGGLGDADDDLGIAIHASGFEARGNEIFSLADGDAAETDRADQRKDDGSILGDAIGRDVVGRLVETDGDEIARRKNIQGRIRVEKGHGGGCWVLRALQGLDPGGGTRGDLHGGTLLGHIALIEACHAGCGGTIRIRNDSSLLGL